MRRLILAVALMLIAQAASAAGYVLWQSPDGRNWQPVGIYQSFDECQQNERNGDAEFKFRPSSRRRVMREGVARRTHYRMQVRLAPPGVPHDSGHARVLFTGVCLPQGARPQ